VAAEDERRSQHQELLNWVKSLKMVTTIDRYHNIPHIRNITFHGLGGSNKTQLALEFAYRHLSSYNAVFWISVDTELKLAESFAALAFELGITSESMQQLSQVREIFKR
jgi:KaiC/GvpD/RAD55 family RecA-like ATPase